MLAVLLLISLLGALKNVETVAVCTAEGPKFGEAPISDVLKSMTVEEKVLLLIGIGSETNNTAAPTVGETKRIVPGAAGATHEIRRLCIPPVVVADGPAGLRISPERPDSDQKFYCTAFPIATLLASSWDIDVVQKVGIAMGNEAKEYGVDVILGPAMNIQRNPLCGRDFEYYSEDPVLSGEIAAAMVNGIQSNGVGVSIKHFVANNQETNRAGNDVIISERALRELYLRNFEIAVKKAAPWTVMSSYNYVNGVFTSESRPLLTNVLREEWKFDGLVMTDWHGGRNPSAQMHAGNDLLMPGRDDQKQALLEAAKNGTLSMLDLDTNVERMLKFIQRTPRFQQYEFSNKPDLEAHATVSRQAAAEGMILLKNDKNVLPLTETVKTVAAFGVTSYDMIAGGTGSGNVHKSHMVMLPEGLTSAGYTVDKELADQYATYIAQEEAKMPVDPNPRPSFFPQERIPELVLDAASLSAKAKLNDVAVITIGRTSGEFADRVIKDFSLTSQEISLIQTVTQAFHDEKKSSVVVLNIGGVIETASWKEVPDAILLAWQPGQEAGFAIADILSGTVNPSGRLPMTFPDKYMDLSSSANFPYNYTRSAKEIQSDFEHAGGRPLRHVERNVDYTNYDEGVFVGYRYQQTNNQATSYPFGYGLSFTRFTYDNATVLEQNGAYYVSVYVQNAGELPGKEVVQVYLVPPSEASVPRPARELKAFSKTKLLQPGEVEEVKFEIPVKALAFFDEKESAWVVDSGRYLIQLSSSSENTQKELFVDTKERLVTEKVRPLTVRDDGTPETSTRSPQSTSSATTHSSIAILCWSVLWILVVSASSIC